MKKTGTIAATFLAMLVAPASAFASESCDLSKFVPGNGLSASVEDHSVEVRWAGDLGQEGRLRFVLQDGVPVLRSLSLRKSRGQWRILVRDASPDYAIVTGLRRMSRQQITPLNHLGIKLTQAELNAYRWDPFWDAPLDLSTEPNPNPRNPPPEEGIAGTDQPGLPRSPAEVRHARATYHVSTCSVKSHGNRIEVDFPGVTLGMFEGSLRYTVYRGSNLVRQELLASTAQNWIAYKYDAGLADINLAPESEISWRDTSDKWQSHHFRDSPSTGPISVQGTNRLIVARQDDAGSIAAFPPPHHFWAREVAINMGYNYYWKTPNGTFSFGIRQNDKEHASENPANWALYSARPGTLQSMPVYFYPSLGSSERAYSGAAAFTRNDRYKALPGYKVINHHFHMDLPKRWKAHGVEARLPDFDALRAVGLDIVSPVWSLHMGGFEGAADPHTMEENAKRVALEGLPLVGDHLAQEALVIKGAQLHSDKDFLIMPSVEIYDGPLGGHTDLLFSHPVLFDQKKPGQSFREMHPTYGPVYHVGSADELMEMVREEEVMLSMPHPRTKGSTGYPDAIRDKDYLYDRHFAGFGFRWGMGLDGSERRTCEYRCLPLLDDWNNWAASRNAPPKFINSISEVQSQSPGDDIYGSSPVTYVNLSEKPLDSASVISALMNGDSFVTTGEVLLSHFNVDQSGSAGKVAADVEWTFPLAMVELVWGDGHDVGRTIVATDDLPSFGKKHFEIPFNTDGVKWVRFAAWDTAFGGALTQARQVGADNRSGRPVP